MVCVAVTRCSVTLCRLLDLPDPDLQVTLTRLHYKLVLAGVSLHLPRTTRDCGWEEARATWGPGHAKTR